MESSIRLSEYASKLEELLHVVVFVACLCHMFVNIVTTCCSTCCLPMLLLLLLHACSCYVVWYVVSWLLLLLHVVIACMLLFSFEKQTKYCVILTYGLDVWQDVGLPSPQQPEPTKSKNAHHIILSYHQNI